MQRLMALPVLLVVSTLAQPADVEAGKARAAAVCAACHGLTGVSVSDSIPNLAAQRAGYLRAQLRALKEGSRKNGTMNAIAAQLSAEDIDNVAAYFASLPGPATDAKSPFLPALAKTGVTFPEDYKSTFVKYHTMNFPATKQVRHFYANQAALQAARQGKALPDGSFLFAEVYAARLDAEKKPVTGADGFYVADQLLFYTAMAREAGWGKDFPDMLRNDDWNYAAFSLDRKHRPINQAECLACHKPLERDSYAFTMKQLAEAAKAR